ncbi:MAG: class I SAM-dependent methyltransferase [Luteolibacter sp.]|uniref:class I SAM-dependent methyltransferase n=1 Tax=Luteolibacter sp. TaxID=1962973 RepID=UPI0032657D8A
MNRPLMESPGKPFRIHPVVLIIVALSLCLAWVLPRRDAVQPPGHEYLSAKKQEGSGKFEIVEKPFPEISSPYTFAPESPDGIGKFFHGREIAHVMGHPAIGWLERKNREDEEAPSRAINALNLAPNAVIADIGAGSGYYSFRIAPKVPLGRVVAVDIQPEMLDFLKKRSEELKIGNVQPHLGTVNSVALPEKSLDAALMVDAYHEFSEPAEMLESLFKSLKPGGKIFLLEYRAEDAEVPIKPLHKMTEAQARLEFEQAGFRFVENRKELPWQHFLVFERPPAN